VAILTETLHLLEDKITTSIHHHKKKIFNGKTSPQPSILNIFLQTPTYPDKEAIITHQPAL
jgi:hypothetical protein